MVFVLSWHRKKEPVGEPLTPWGKSIHQVALMFGAVISLRWRGAAGEGVETVHTPPGGRISLLVMFILIHILSSWHHHRDHHHDHAPATASLWQGVAILLESSPKFMCCMSLMALQNTYSTGCFLPTLAYRQSSELIKRKLYFLFLFILCLYSLLLTLVDFILLGQN